MAAVQEPDRRHPERDGGRGRPRRTDRRRRGGPRDRGAVPRRAGPPAPGRAGPSPGGDRRLPSVPGDRRGGRSLQGARSRPALPASGSGSSTTERCSPSGTCATRPWEPGSRGDEPRHRLRSSGAAVVGLPVFLYGAVVNALPYLVPRWLARAFARKETDYATIRLLSSVVAFPALLGPRDLARVGRPGHGLGASRSRSRCPLSGLLAYHYLRGLDRLRARTGFAVLALTHRQAAARLLVRAPGDPRRRSSAQRRTFLRRAMPRPGARIAGRQPVAAAGVTPFRATLEAPLEARGTEPSGRGRPRDGSGCDERPPPRGALGAGGRRARSRAGRSRSSA